MLALLRILILHVFRSKLLVALVFFTLAVQFVGVRIIHSMTLTWQGMISQLDFRDVLFVALLFQLCSGGFLAAAYGLWIAPYLHRGQREQMAFCLPMGKWNFPLANLIILGLLVGVQHALLMGAFGVNLGWSVFKHENFPWMGMFAGLGIELLAFEFAMFAFAVGALALGVIPSLLFGVALVFLLQAVGAVVRLKLDRMFIPGSQLQSVYGWLPPIGELVYDLRTAYVKPLQMTLAPLGLWAVWMGVVFLIFWYLVKHPRLSRQSDI